MNLPAMQTLQQFCLSLCLLMLGAGLLQTASAQDNFQFGVIGHVFKGGQDESLLRQALADSDADNLAFVVINGIKAVSEPCSDALYSARRVLLQEAENGVIVSLAASDWAVCTKQERSIAMDRLSRMRDLFFTSEFSFGASKIPLMRQSITLKFRSYSENARWEFGNVLFATVNLPSANNHFVSAGGRNSEFEDRLIANEDWLNRLFTLAKQRKMAGIVLFCDGNPLAQPHQRPFLLRGQRDGFVEMRRHITALAAGFQGKVLLVHGEDLKMQSNSRILWRRNLGSIGVAAGWSKLAVSSGPELFALVATKPAATSP